jgi:hypothetical protein
VAVHEELVVAAEEATLPVAALVQLVLGLTIDTAAELFGGKA